MNIIKILTFASMTLISFGFQGDNVERISFYKLLANPEQYDGKRIQLEGVLHNEFEDSGLYPSKEYSSYLICSSAFWIDYIETPKIEDMKGRVTTLKYLDKKFVRIIGSFNKDKHGHLGAFAGTIEKVDYIFELRNWDEPRE